MDYTEDPVYDEIRQAVRQLCAKFDDTYWQEHDDSKEFPWEFYNAVAEAGWLGLTIPEEYGGGGLGVQEVCVVEQEIAASGAGMNGCSAVHIGMFGFESMIRYGTEEMKQKYLPRVVTGELHVSFCSHRARCWYRHYELVDLRQEGGWRLSHQRQEGVDHQGAGSRKDVHPGPHHTAGSSRKEDRWSHHVLRTDGP